MKKLIRFEETTVELTASYKTREGKVNKITLSLDKNFVESKRDSLKSDFTRFIVHNIMEKYEAEPTCDADLLVIFTGDPERPLYER